MPEERWQKMLLGYIDYYGEGQVPEWVDPKKKIDTEEKRQMWNKLNVELGRWRTKIYPAIRDGRGRDIIRHDLGWYQRKGINFIGGDRSFWNKKIDNAVGVKPFTIKEKKTTGKAGQDNLIRLISEMN